MRFPFALDAMPIIVLEEITSCDACGACCYGMEVDVSEGDFARGLDRALTRVKPDGVTILRQIGVKKQCVALSPAGRCTTYETRPQVCRDFDRGEVDCAISRRRQGISSAVVTPNG